MTRDAFRGAVFACTVAAVAVVAILAGWPAVPPARAGHGAAGQTNPVDNFHLHVCAFHVAKNNPKIQIESYHYCGPHSESLHQCVIYDNDGTNAKLLGVEYIITDDVYRSLPESEKKYYHSHAYEILAGQLIAPGMATEKEDELMKVLLTTWGKTWHTWPDPSTALPMGEPLLMWSASGDGQLDSRMIASREGRFGVSATAIREHRKSYGFTVPNIPSPTSMDALGRQWTASGKDEPTAISPSSGGSTTARP